jgi:hypothetical protein
VPRLWLIALASFAIALPACGGDEVGKAEYEKEVAKAGRALESSFRKIAEGITSSTSPKEAAAKLEQGAEALDGAAADLDGIDPPGEIEDPHEEMVSGLEELADDFREGAQAARSGDVDRLVRFASDLQGSAAVKKIAEAGNEIREKGYKVET